MGKDGKAYSFEMNFLCEQQADTKLKPDHNKSAQEKRKDKKKEKKRGRNEDQPALGQRVSFAQKGPLLGRTDLLMIIGSAVNTCLGKAFFFSTLCGRPFTDPVSNCFGGCRTDELIPSRPIFCCSP